jgi:hypothetical protein
MKSNIYAALAVVAILLMVSSPVQAHHGTAAFDMNRWVSLKGTVTSFEWTNPHSYVYLDVKDDKGNVEKWTSEGGSPLMLSRYGWNRESIKKGDQVTVSGHPAKDGSKFMRLEKVVLPDGKELPGNALVG